MRKSIILMVLLAFFAASFVPSSLGQPLMSKPGEMAVLSAAFHVPIFKGLKIHKDDPFRLDFILDRGDNSSFQAQDTLRFVKYFLAALTVPTKDLWVNLSPYEKDRIVPEAFGQTEMGRDLLAQDYALKQLTSSLLYPENEPGKEFWAKVYARAQERFGTVDVPVDAFNKVWIVPAAARVYENGTAAYVVTSRLKVMLDEDHTAGGQIGVKEGSPDDLSRQLMREIIIPVLEKEVNEGRSFARVRQAYNSLILALWYKKKVKSGILAVSYVDRKKIRGIHIDDPRQADKIWAQYVEAFRKGAFSLIKEERDEYSQEMVPRKYFSGGLGFDQAEQVLDLTATRGDIVEADVEDTVLVRVEPDRAEAPGVLKGSFELKGVGRCSFLGPVTREEREVVLDAWFEQKPNRRAFPRSAFLKKISAENGWVAIQLDTGKLLGIGIYAKRKRGLMGPGVVLPQGKTDIYHLSIMEIDEDYKRALDADGQVLGRGNGLGKVLLAYVIGQSFQDKALAPDARGILTTLPAKEAGEGFYYERLNFQRIDDFNGYPTVDFELFSTAENSKRILDDVGSKVEQFSMDKAQSQRTGAYMLTARSGERPAFLFEAVLSGRAALLKLLNTRDPEKALSPNPLKGKCALSSADLEKRVLAVKGQPDNRTVVRHQVVRVLKRSGIIQRNGHGFLVVSAGGNDFLVDITYLQFFSLMDMADENNPGHILDEMVKRGKTQWAALASKLLHDGFIELTDDVADMYLTSLSGPVPFKRKVFSRKDLLWDFDKNAPLEATFSNGIPEKMLTGLMGPLDNFAQIDPLGIIKGVEDGIRRSSLPLIEAHVSTAGDGTGGIDLRSAEDILEDNRQVVGVEMQAGAMRPDDIQGYSPVIMGVRSRQGFSQLLVEDQLLSR